MYSLLILWLGTFWRCVAGVFVANTLAGNIQEVCVVGVFVANTLVGNIWSISGLESRTSGSGCSLCIQ